LFVVLHIVIQTLLQKLPKPYQPTFVSRANRVASLSIRKRSGEYISRCEYFHTAFFQGAFTQRSRSVITAKNLV
jgi:hypothetical protein